MFICYDEYAFILGVRSLGTHEINTQPFEQLWLLLMELSLVYATLTLIQHVFFHCRTTALSSTGSRKIFRIGEM